MSRANLAAKPLGHGRSLPCSFPRSANLAAKPLGHGHSPYIITKDKGCRQVYLSASFIFRANALLIAYAKIGVTGFEPAASWSQTRRSSQTEPHPDKNSCVRFLDTLMIIC